MSEPKTFASLSPSLLARKGGARPAMRPQIYPMHHFHEATARQLDDDLGWNDMGHDHAHDHADSHGAAQEEIGAEIEAAESALAEVPVAQLEAKPRRESAACPEAEPEAEIVALNGVEPVPQEVPEVVRQQADVAKAIAKGTARTAKPRKAGKAGLSSGRRAAFTLRLDAERHLKLRLACTVGNRSAQQIVTEALDRLIAEMPEIVALAAQVHKRS